MMSIFHLEASLKILFPSLAGYESDIEKIPNFCQLSEFILVSCCGMIYMIVITLFILEFHAGG